jgi:hypothetical protein
MCLAASSAPVNKLKQFSALSLMGNLPRECRVSTAGAAVPCCSTGSYMTTQTGSLHNKEANGSYKDAENI